MLRTGGNLRHEAVVNAMAVGLVIDVRRNGRPPLTGQIGGLPI